MRLTGALILLAGLALAQPAAAVNIYSRINVTFDPSLNLTLAQQSDLTSSVAAHMASRIAVTEDWRCVKPPSVTPPDIKQEAIPSQPGNQLYEVIKLDVKVLGGSISTMLSRQTDVGRYTTLASNGLPLDISGLGRGDALEHKIADLLALAVDSTMLQAHPCGRWTGKIEFREERTDESHSEMWDTSNHRLLDITITLDNQGVATAHTHLEQKETSEGRRFVRANGVTSLVRDSWQTTTVNGDGDTKANVGVSVIPQTKTYSISASFQPITAHKHTEGCSRNPPVPCRPSDLDFAVTWDGSGSLGGTLDDPKHLHGKIPLIDRKSDTTTETQTEEWDLKWEP